MTHAVLYRWRIKDGCELEFRAAWRDATRLIHRYCGSYGARMHRAANGDFVSYARWPSEAARQACFDRAELRDDPSFERMRACVEERYEEELLELLDDELRDFEEQLDVPELTGERVWLSALAIEDAEALHAALSDDTNVKYWLRPAVESLDETCDIVRRNITSGAVQSFAIRELSPDGSGPLGDAFGWVILMDRREGCAEIGYMTCPAYQGRGFARDAVARVLRYAFDERKLRRVYADTDPENAPSVALLEKLGFELEGRLRADWLTHLGVRDTALYSIVRLPYQTSQSPLLARKGLDGAPDA